MLRQPYTMLAPVAVWVFCAGAVADAVIEGSPSYAARVVVLMAAVALAAWLLLASPCLVVEPDALRIVNPLRVHHVPFSAVDHVRVRGLTSVIVRQPSGVLRAVTSWNAPGQPRRPSASAPLVTEVFERTRATWESSVRGAPDPAPPVTTWRWRPALSLVVLVVANIAIWFR